MKRLLFLFLAVSLGASYVIAQSDLAATAVIETDSCLQQPTTKTLVIRSIILQGNNVTKDRILLRELEFSPGDTLSMRELCQRTARSRQNLLNRALFNFVTISASISEQGYPAADIVVDVIERWYVWPLPIFELAERNFNTWWETKDFRRANYGMFLTYNNFRGRMEVLKILLRAGYNQHYFLLYEIPYLTRSQDFGIGVELGYTTGREMAFKTENNRHVYFRNPDGYVRSQLYAKMQFTYRKGIHNHHFMALGYERHRFADTLLKLNPDFLPDLHPETRFLHLNYRFRHDFRDSKPYPLNGHYLDVELDKKGFGLLSDEPNLLSIKGTFDVYRPITTNWHWAFSVSAKMAAGEQEPYYFMRGLGYNNEFVRSYELFVMDGQAYGLWKSNLKYTLIQPRNRTLPLVTNERFSKIHYATYLNLIFDAGYVKNKYAHPSNTCQNKMLFGTGLGVDLVTYYDLVWRFEYTINQFGKHGFFVHFVAPI